MKKGTKLAALLLGIALVIPACTIGGSGKSSTPAEQSNQESGQPSESSKQEANYTVTIKNKTALQEKWTVGDPSRKIEIETEPKANISELIGEGIIEVISSDTTKLTILGQMATPVAEGEVNVTVKCGESQDSVALTLNRKLSNKEKFEIEHEGTAEDPLTNEEAVKVANASNYNNEDLYVRGVVDAFYHSPGERTDGAVSWYFTPAEANGKKFEVYKCYKKGGAFLTDDDIWVGGTATAHGTFTVYNGTQAETNGSAEFVSCTGEKPQPRQTINATVAEALTAGKALADGSSSWDYYNVTGYVVKKSSPNYFLADTAEAAADDKNMLELYNVADDIAPKLTKNAKVTVKMILKNYHGQIENGPAIADADVTVVTPGGEWIVVPEPTVETKTLAEFIALENSKAKAYKVSAEIKSFKNGATKDKYGNMTLTDGTNDLTIYGSTVTETALKWNDADAYVFTNPQDFQTKDLSNNAKIGQIATLKLIRADYQGAIQGTGILLSLADPKATAIELDKETLSVAMGETATLTATLTPASATDTITWTSSDEAVATVANGVVTPVAAGTATITAKVSDEIKAECAVTVVAGSIPATSVELNEASGNLLAGQTATLTATVLPSNTTESTVAWTSSDEAVATVDNGVITTLKAGTATITATAGNVHADYALTVAYANASQNFVGAKINVTGKLMVKNGKSAIVDDGTGGVWSYSSSNVSQNVGDIVTVSGNTVAYKGGLEVEKAVLASGTGTVTPSSATPITAEEVAAYIAAYKLDNNKNLVPTRKVSLTTGVIGGSGNYLTWSYGDALMETTLATGNMEAGKKYNVEGYLANFYKDGDKVYLCMAITQATVVDIAATGIELDENTLDIEAGKSATLKATLAPEGANSSITWESSDTSVATVNNGKVTGVAAGTATITAKVSDDIKAECAVTVSAAQALPNLTEEVSLSYTGLTGKGSKLADSDALAKAGQGNAHVTAVEATNIYDGNGSGGAFANTAGFLKTGTGSATGVLKITLNGLANKVQILCHDFYKKNDSNPTNSNTFSVNGSATQLAPYNAEGEFGVLTFNLTSASEVIEITVANRAYIKSIVISYVV